MSKIGNPTSNVIVLIIGAETEAMMTSVERVLFTINQTPQEQQQQQRGNYHSLPTVSGVGDFTNQTEPVDNVATYRDSNLLRASGWPWQGGRSVS